MLLAVIIILFVVAQQFFFYALAIKLNTYIRNKPKVYSDAFQDAQRRSKKLDLQYASIEFLNILLPAIICYRWYTIIKQETAMEKEIKDKEILKQIVEANPDTIELDINSKTMQLLIQEYSSKIKNLM